MDTVLRQLPLGFNAGLIAAQIAFFLLLFLFFLWRLNLENNKSRKKRSPNMA